MFLAWRDILFAKGRFALMGLTVALITFLLVMLTGLTGGLGRQNTDLLERLEADRLVFAPSNPGDKASFTDSSVSQALVDSWQQAGLQAQPLALMTSKIQGQSASSLTLAASPAQTPQRPADIQILEGQDPQDQEVLLPQTLAQEIGVGTGDRVTILGAELTVSGLTQDAFYSHTPVGWITTSTWQALTHQPAQEASSPVGSIILASGQADYQALAQQTGTQALTAQEAFSALPAYSSENASLRAMQGFLYLISSLVIVSFLTIWTIQRTQDIAILRALGASRGFLFKDALAQAALVLAAGSLLGTLAAWALGSYLQGLLPFQLSALILLGPALGIWILGMLGALGALSRVTTVDPLLALGGN